MGGFVTQKTGEKSKHTKPKETKGCVRVCVLQLERKLHFGKKHKNNSLAGHYINAMD